MRGLLSILLVLATAGAGMAFTPPAGCTPKLTVQSRSCLMSNIWTCDGDPPGHQWMALFTGDGPQRVRMVDDEFQWLETYLLSPIRTERMVVPAPDPENLTELFSTKHDTYDFTVKHDDGTSLRYIGYDRLPGEEVVIDGERLLRTEYAYDVYNDAGVVVQRREGRQFVSEKHRLFFFGKSWDQDDPDRVTDASPVEFIYPGEPGFFPNAPIYDCGALMSALPDPKAHL